MPKFDRKLYNLDVRSSIHVRQIRFMRVKREKIIRNCLFFIYSELLLMMDFFWVQYLDSERYLNMICNCKLFSVRVFLFVISHVFDFENIMHIITNIDSNHIIPVFHFVFPTDFINSYSLNFRHEAFHHVPCSHNIICMLYLLRNQSSKRRYILKYTA